MKNFPFSYLQAFLHSTAVKGEGAKASAELILFR